ncbi:histidine phosphatase family protein [Cytobacillus suaedae]|nr:histidine phosphatase family protein [Cytobacillus suaedae]
MEISLIRHGKSTLSDNNPININDFMEWIKKYDNEGVLEEEKYPVSTIEKINTSSIVITSDLKRSIDSANLLTSEKKPLITDTMYREAALPSLKGIGLKLRPSVWLVLLRCLWIIGYSNRCESFKEAKQRAKKASSQLVDYATTHHSVILVGHGIFNRLLAKELEKRGWKTKGRASSKHWSCTTFSLD